MPKKKKVKKVDETKKPTEVKESNYENNDFGGFPNRDLKKNLGCG